MEAVIQAKYSDERIGQVDGYHMEKLVPDVRKGPANFRWFATPTSIIKMRFSESPPQPSANLLVGDRSALWLTDFETPVSIKRTQF